MSQASKHFDFDVAIIGGGSGGYAAARTAADAGLRTVVIEGGEEVGGLCILRGCMPTKALLYKGEVAPRAACGYVGRGAKPTQACNPRQSEACQESLKVGNPRQ